MSVPKISNELTALMRRKLAHHDPQVERRAAAFEAGVARTKPRRGKRTPKRYRPRSPDREASRNRRRMLGGGGALPNTIRWHYTEGERAVLCVVAGEMQANGYCDLPLDAIAARAGVSRTTTQNALRQAAALNHVKVTRRPRLGAKSLPNVVEVVSLEWLLWIKRGPWKHWRIGFNFGNLLNPTKTLTIQHEQSERAERSERGIQGVQAARPGPTQEVLSEARRTANL
jgi:hypothetical protein